MPRTIRFHPDEHCNPAIAAGPRLHEMERSVGRFDLDVTRRERERLGRLVEREV